MYGFAGVKGGCVLSNGFTELAELLARCGTTMIPDLERISRKAGECLDGGCKILVVGNGGSAAEAQHFAAELLGRFAEDRKPFAAIALSCDSSTLTAVANDYGFEQVFERQVAALAQPGDLLLVLSTSGNSPNVIAAAVKAKKMGCVVIGMTGAGGGKLSGLVDVLLSVPSASVARVQEVHLLCLHLLASYLEGRRFEPSVSTR
jgi:D-sedoheptulose 7-phosphate isomerase